MNTGLAIAGVTCVVMALGHMTIGLVWVLPHVDEEHLPSTPFGPPTLTEGMVRVTWHIVTLFVLALGGVLATLGWAPTTDARSLLLRWFGVMFLAATAMALFVARRTLRYVLHLPVWLLWIAVAALCWQAAA